jgi:hypothetical protein
MKLNFPEFESLFEKAQSSNLAFSLDWKFPVEDIVFNVKSVLPKLDIKSLPEKQILGDWTQSMTVEGHEYSFKADSPALIMDVISTVNKHIKKDNQTLIFFDTQDDDKYFFLINLPDLPDYLEKGFIEV